MNDIAVVSCVWQRPERLRATLDGLAAQTWPVDLLLICNNPDLERFVERTAEDTAWPFSHDIRMWFMAENRGPFARVEVMYECREEYGWFLFVDDDLDFGPDLVEKWVAQREAETLKSWQGWRFVGDYWQREPAKVGEKCDYLLGSNMLIPAEALADIGVLDIPNGYRLCCDDLWLCYWAQHEMGMRLVAGEAQVAIKLDGKDTYICYTDTKRVFLEELRTRGWTV